MDIATMKKGMPIVYSMILPMLSYPGRQVMSSFEIASKLIQ